jgi:chromosome segregation ATPase
VIFLIAKIFVYLLVALGLGVAAGWLWRNLQAAGRETDIERSLMETRSRVPQLETALRARDERLEAALAEIEALQADVAGQAGLLAERDSIIAKLERNCAELRERVDAGAVAEAAPADADAEAAADGARRDLEMALAAVRDELERAQRTLTAEQRRVAELTRERELQRRSLDALEQQLDLAREDQARIANG